MEAINKIHHISAIVGNPVETVEFYRDILGLKFVKRTVNFDDPGVYHLYFGDDDATPGTIITFFNWVNAYEGRVGSGQVGRIAFRIPKGSLDYWKTYLEEKQIDVRLTGLFNGATLEFTDYHGLALALVEGTEEADNHKIIGFHGSMLLSSKPDVTLRTLTDDMGLVVKDTTDYFYHLETIGAERHHLIIPRQPLRNGRWGGGTVHHIAWSVPNKEVHREWQEDLYNKGYAVTEIKPRHYFDAIYLKEKGDIIFEYATDTPGFFIDETKEEAGSSLMLPPWYEGHRAEYEAALPELNV